MRASPLALPALFCLTLGLAPFRPEPHVVEKLRMLSAGTLTRPLDIFDLLLHGSPWVVLCAMVIYTAVRPAGQPPVDDG